MPKDQKPENLTTDSQALEYLEEFEQRQANAFNNLHQGFSQLMADYQAQTRVAIGLLEEKYGIELSPEMAQYKEMMDRRTAELEAQAQANADAEAAFEDEDVDVDALVAQAEEDSAANE